jgi:hypothetical protein
MGAVKALLRELVGLFIDDGSLAVSVLVWVALCGIVAPSLGVTPLWRGVALAAGLAALLLENAYRGARPR